MAHLSVVIRTLYLCDSFERIDKHSFSMLYFLCDSFERIDKHSFSMLYFLCDSFERIDKHSFAHLSVAISTLFFMLLI